MGIHVDTSQLDRLMVDFTRAPARVRASGDRVMYGSAGRVKRGMKRDATGHRFLPKFQDAVSSEKHGALDYEIGFDKKGQGRLAHLIVFGSSNNAPVYDWLAPLRKETPVLEQKLADAAEDSTLGDS